MAQQSIYHLFRNTVRADPEAVAYQHRKDEGWVDVSWASAAASVRRISAALIALGVEHGDRVAVLSQTRLEWMLCDLGIAGCGAVTVGIYPSSLPDECRYIIDHSDAVLLVAEDKEQLAKLTEIRGELPKLRRIVVLEGPGDETSGVMSWEAFLARGEDLPDEEVARRGEAIRPDDLAALVYTSGTTGVPKGVMITHHNMVFTVGSACGCIPIETRFVMLLFLPLAHVFARLMVYCCLLKQATVAFAENLTTVVRDIQETRPHFIPSAPRIYEKVYEAVVNKAEAAGGLKRKLFWWAAGVGREVSDHIENRTPVPPLLRLRHALADRLVLRKIRNAFGGHMVFAISGSAPLNPEIGRFFNGCGVIILEGIGMTENTSFSNVNRIGHNKFGTVGPIGPGLEMKIAPDGEVLFRGGHVMKGYFKNPEATAETIDADGWLHTGDVGEIDEDGFLRITDRKKELIVTSGGKNVAPARLEILLRSSPYIAQAVAYGDKRKYITALIDLDEERLGRWAAARGLDALDRAALSRRHEVHELIAAEVERLNEQLASFETIKKFFIVPQDLTVESGDLTPSLKLRRRHVVDKYSEELAALYEPSALSSS